MALLGGIIKRNRNVPLKSGASEGRIDSLLRPARVVRRLPGRLLVCFLSISGLSAWGQEVAKEYDAKAAILSKLPLFVEWPSNAFADSTTPITIAIVGKNPFGKSLEAFVRDSPVGKRKLVVEPINRVEDIKNCHILFISRSESGKLDEIFAGLRGHPILTVGESDRFAENGGIIEFVVKDKKTRMRINEANATAEALKLSYKLKSLPGVELIEKKKEK